MPLHPPIRLREDLLSFQVPANAGILDGFPWIENSKRIENDTVLQIYRNLPKFIV